MRTRLLKAGLAAVAMLLGLGGTAVAGGVVNTGIFGGVAIKGYDTVAYFTDGKAVKGSKAFAYEWLGTPWYFANAKHREMFAAKPTKYAPQYGGYCTLGIAIDSHAAENIDPETSWRIIDGKLYFVYSPAYVGELDGPDRDKWIRKANANWPAVQAKVAKEMTN